MLCIQVRPRVYWKTESIQGKKNIYFAGSYCVFGMGLLEQAAASGKRAAEKLLDDAACAWLNEGDVSAESLE